MSLYTYILIGIFPIILSGQPMKHTPDERDFTMGSNSISVNSQYLTMDHMERTIDSIMEYSIKEKAFPGAQLLVASKGNIIFHKTYGYHTYDSIRPVGKMDLYDLASVTKIIGPLPALMKLYEEEKIDLDVPFSTYWKPWRNSADKKDITLREILAHQAGLKPYIVFLKEVLKENGLKRKYVRSTYNRRFQNQAYENLFIKNSFKNKMFREINKSEIDIEKTYRYSGLAFLLFPDLIAQISGNSYEYYITKNFYLPLGATGLTFNPKARNLPNKIVPTEIDTFYRNDLVRGWVHDENASLLGGISGNAGLFGTAKDLFKMMQLFQNYGEFDNKRYLNEDTVKEFTAIQYPENNNRRGLGFDKPLIDNAELSLDKAYPAPEVSAESFGHSGFTGTFVWADPKYHLVYIFLSNRVYPTREHRKLYDLNIRTAVQQVIYKALVKAESVN